MNSICSQKPEVAGLWIGETLLPLAELCIRSYLSHGIPFRLFTYRNYENIPEGTMVRMPRRSFPKNWFSSTTTAALHRLQTGSAIRGLREKEGFGQIWTSPVFPQTCRNSFHGLQSRNPG